MAAVSLCNVHSGAVIIATSLAIYLYPIFTGKIFIDWTALLLPRNVLCLLYQESKLTQTTYSDDFFVSTTSNLKKKKEKKKLINETVL